MVLGIEAAVREQRSEQGGRVQGLSLSTGTPLPSGRQL